MLLAIERGEVDGLCGWGWDGGQVNGRDFFERGVIQVGSKPPMSAILFLKECGVPFALDLVKSEKDRKVWEFLFSYLVYVRPFIVPPEVPADRLKALQSAFKATLEDPEFLAEAKEGPSGNPLYQPGAGAGGAGSGTRRAPGRKRSGDRPTPAIGLGRPLSGSLLRSLFQGEAQQRADNRRTLLYLGTANEKAAHQWAAFL